jgi:hypothetical protein
MQGFLSFSHGFYRIIFQAMPICADKRTMREALEAAAALGVPVSNEAWNGDRAEWVHLHTIEE